MSQRDIDERDGGVQGAEDEVDCETALANPKPHLPPEFLLLIQSDR